MHDERKSQLFSWNFTSVLQVFGNFCDMRTMARKQNVYHIFLTEWPFNIALAIAVLFRTSKKFLFFYELALKRVQNLLL